jgi:hypothetical protein
MTLNLDGHAPSSPNSWAVRAGLAFQRGVLQGCLLSRNLVCLADIYFLPIRAIYVIRG